MTHKTAQRIVLYGIFIGLILGVAVGFWMGPSAVMFSWLGEIFLRALKMIIVPLIVASMICGITSLGDVRKLGRTGAVTLAYYMVTTGLAVAVGIILVNIIQPGAGVERVGAVPDILTGKDTLSFTDVILGMVPDNLFNAAAEYADDQADGYSGSSAQTGKQADCRHGVERRPRKEAIA